MVQTYSRVYFKHLGLIQMFVYACRHLKNLCELGLRPKFGLRTKSDLFYQVTQCSCLPTATSCPFRTAVPSPHRAELIAASGVSVHCFSTELLTSKSPLSRPSCTAVVTQSPPAGLFESTLPLLGTCGQNLIDMRTRVSFKMAMHINVLTEIKTSNSQPFNDHIKTAQQRTICNTVTGTLTDDGWAVTFGTPRTGLCMLWPHPVPSSMY